MERWRLIVCFMIFLVAKSNFPAYADNWKPTCQEKRGPTPIYDSIIFYSVKTAGICFGPLASAYIHTLQDLKEFTIPDFLKNQPENSAFLFITASAGSASGKIFFVSSSLIIQRTGASKYLGWSIIENRNNNKKVEFRFFKVPPDDNIEIIWPGAYILSAHIDARFIDPTISQEELAQFLEPYLNYIFWNQRDQQV